MVKYLRPNDLASRENFINQLSREQQLNICWIILNL